MRDIALAFLFGALVGAVFAFAGRPIPAPPTLAGAAGVIGVTIGFIVVHKLRR